MSLFSSNREVRKSAASRSVHVYQPHCRTLLWGTVATLQRVTACWTDRAPRKISVTSPFVFIVPCCYISKKILNLTMKGQEPKLSFRKGHDNHSADVKHSLSDGQYLRYLFALFHTQITE